MFYACTPAIHLNHERLLTEAFGSKRNIHYPECRLGQLSQTINALPQLTTAKKTTIRNLVYKSTCITVKGISRAIHFHGLCESLYSVVSYRQTCVCRTACGRAGSSAYRDRSIAKTVPRPDVTCKRHSSKTIFFRTTSMMEVQRQISSRAESGFKTERYYELGRCAGTSKKHEEKPSTLKQQSSSLLERHWLQTATIILVGSRQ